MGVSSAEAEAASRIAVNERTVLASFEAFNRGDTEGVLAQYTDDLEYHNLPELDGASVSLGHDGLRAWLAGARAIGGEQMRFEPSILAAEGDLVLARGKSTNVGRGARIPTEWTAYAVYDMRDGKIHRVRMFFELADAEAASGLSASE